MATIEECEAALDELAAKLAAEGSAAQQHTSFDRSFTCAVRDLDVIFGGRLRDGLLTDLRRVADPEAQVRLSMTSDDLIRLVAGELDLGAAWATGRMKVDAGMMDLLRLRTLF